MNRWLTLLLITLSFITPVRAEQADNWPVWLGSKVKQSAQANWNISQGEESVRLSSISKQSKVWVILSKKADSYDTALKTMLNVYQKQADDIEFRVFLLSEQQQDLQGWLKKMEQQADLLYTVGSKATVTIYRQYAGGKVPVVSVNAKDPVLLGLIDSYSGSGNNFAFTSLNLSSSVTLSFIKKYDEQLAQIGVLYAQQNRSAYLTQYLPLKEQAEKQGIAVYPIAVDETVAGSGLNEVMNRQLENMKQQDPDLKHSLLWLTGSSSLLKRVEEINQLSDNLPLLTAVPEAVNKSNSSALMSVGTSFVNNAYQAALYGLKILNKETEPEDLPVGVIYPPDISLNFKQAERIDTVIPFVLVEMASEIYAQDGAIIRTGGMSKELFN